LLQTAIFLFKNRLNKKTTKVRARKMQEHPQHLHWAIGASLQAARPWIEKTFATRQALSEIHGGN
jgi:hypothetical protein